ncbi:MAG TPA: ring-hydroxylating oxygenase subunit alpha, partial [Burkholderiales bacterium]|nr:ring-hydroxylating oxygenase subunit alpha [Burkholderiales bacterium]
SQGLIADRTREHLTATDVGVVRFRKLMLEAAKALRDGREPEAPRRAPSYRVRAGGALTSSKLSFEQVMRERFGSTTGRVQQ